MSGSLAADAMRCRDLDTRFLVSGAPLLIATGATYLRGPREASEAREDRDDGPWRSAAPVVERRPARVAFQRAPALEVSGSVRSTRRLRVKGLHAAIVASAVSVIKVGMYGGVSIGLQSKEGARAGLPVTLCSIL